MKIFTLQSVIAFVIAFLLLLEHVYGHPSSRADDSEEDDDGGSEESGEEDDATSSVTAKPVENNKDIVKITPEQLLQYQQHQILAAPQAYQPYLEDPWYFYKWPGVGQAEGVVGRWPYWPPAVPVKDLTQDEDKDKNKKKKEQEEDEEDDDEDEEQEDFFRGKPKKKSDDDDDSNHGHGYKGKYFKQKPTGVSSLGIGTAKGKKTWWGVLHADVNTRSELSDEQDTDDLDSDNLRSTDLRSSDIRSDEEDDEDDESGEDSAIRAMWASKGLDLGWTRPIDRIGYGEEPVWIRSYQHRRHNYEGMDVK